MTDCKTKDLTRVTWACDGVSSRVTGVTGRREVQKPPSRRKAALRKSYTRPATEVKRKISSPPKNPQAPLSARHHPDRPIRPPSAHRSVLRVPSASSGGFKRAPEYLARLERQWASEYPLSGLPSASDHREGPRGRGSSVEALRGVWRPRLGLLRAAMDLIFFDFFWEVLRWVWKKSGLGLSVQRAHPSGRPGPLEQ